MTEEATAWIVDTTAEAFENDVLARSRELPVVVDFWAEWCAPCRMLGPILEKLATEYAGRFVLVRADSDRLPEAAMSFGVQSIPAVFAVLDGQIADAFTGALPESQIRQWLDRMLLSDCLAQASRLETSDPKKAETKYREVLVESPNESAASIGLARVLLAQDREDEARDVIQQLEDRGFLEPEAEKVKAHLQLRDSSNIDVDSRREAAEANPDNLQAQLGLGEALAGNAQYQEALDIFLALVERDRRGVGEAARKLMIDIFRVLPADSDLVSEYRRKLSTVLY
ncbi:MAG: tetratricopeptide repeat protein [Planctomycetes bacterium]|nr:tetratricopeptide repeat protein [Planctomycetota bacterium]